MKKNEPQICELTISLDVIEPEIWRRVIFPMDSTLGELHELIQVAMGWENSHLYKFKIRSKSYMDLELCDEISDEAQDCWDVTLKELGIKSGSKFEYIYDFGDYWCHTIKVEKVRNARPFEPGFGCRSGARNCPPEDCGGAPGYDTLLEAMRDNKHPEREELMKWVGPDFDPEKFDVDSTNEKIQIEIMMDEDDIEDLFGSDSDLENIATIDQESLKKKMFRKSMFMITSNQLMADDPPETRATMERLTKEGIEEDDAFMMVTAAVSAEIYDSYHSDKGYDNKRLLKRFKELPILE